MFELTEDNKRIIQELNIQSQKSCDQLFDAEKAFYIPQRGAGYTHSRSNFPILATDFLHNCIGVAVYNESTKEAFLTHVDPGCVNDFGRLIEMISALQRDESQTLKVHLRGGDPNWVTVMYPLIEAINKLDHTEIASADLFKPMLGADRGGRKLAIDSRTGAISIDMKCNRITARPSNEELTQDTITLVINEHAPKKSSLITQSIGTPSGPRKR